jgi:hypothetical protein
MAFGSSFLPWFILSAVNATRKCDLHHEVIHELALTHSEKAAFVMPAWIAGIQVCMDASGDVHVDLDSSPSCWNDGIGGLFFNRAKLIYSFFKEDAKNTKFKSQEI